jgi:hypothetical protein
MINSALIAGLFLYALVVELIKSQFKPFAGFLPEVHFQSLRYIFYGAAIAAVVLARISARVMTRAAPEEDIHRFGQRLSRGTIVTATLAELPAGFGFVLFLLAGFSRDFIFLLFVSLFLEFMYFPRYRVWQDLAREKFPKEGI